jgi:hypothetical protein
MKIDDLPSKKRTRFPCVRTLKISLETNAKLDKIEAADKDVAETIRQFIDEGLSKLDFEESAG